jgi:hypothetical protein
MMPVTTVVTVPVAVAAHTNVELIVAALPAVAVASAVHVPHVVETVAVRPTTPVPPAVHVQVVVIVDGRVAVPFAVAVHVPHDEAIVP